MPFTLASQLEICQGHQWHDRRAQTVELLSLLLKWVPEALTMSLCGTKELIRQSIAKT